MDRRTFLSWLSAAAAYVGFNVKPATAVVDGRGVTYSTAAVRLRPNRLHIMMVLSESEAGVPELPIPNRGFTLFESQVVGKYRQSIYHCIGGSGKSTPVVINCGEKKPDRVAWTIQSYAGVRGLLKGEQQLLAPPMGNGPVTSETLVVGSSKT